MDLTVRDWMVIIGVLLIFAVLLDAYRRVRSDRREKTRVIMTKQAVETTSEGDEELPLLKELPNGGARVIERGDLLRSAAASRQAEERVRQNEQAAEAEQESESGQSDDTADSVAVEDVDLVAGMSSNSEPENLDWLDGMGSRDEVRAPKVEDEVRLHRSLDPEVFMLNVVSRDNNGFRGEDILHILLACDLRFGDMSFFHRHEQEAGRGPIQFSVANMVQPGVFDLDHMAEINTPGLVFFVTLPGPEDMMQAFDYMLETAQAVARNLDGDVLDESRSALTKQTLEHCRQQIRDLERRLLTASAR
ncbi:MAG: cell division protein ZipA [Halioglobus sp.]